MSDVDSTPPENAECLLKPFQTPLEQASLHIHIHHPLPFLLFSPHYHSTLNAEDHFYPLSFSSTFSHIIFIFSTLHQTPQCFTPSLLLSIQNPSSSRSFHHHASPPPLPGIHSQFPCCLLSGVVKRCKPDDYMLRNEMIY